MNACARNAPDLPPAYSENSKSDIVKSLGITDEQQAYSCDKIKLRQDEVLVQYQKNENVIKSNRTQNQVAGYFGAVLFLPALIAVENDGSAKETLDALQRRKDQLNFLAKDKKCSRT